MNFENDPEVTHAKAIPVLNAGHFFHSLVARIFRELVEGFIEPHLEFSISNFAQRL